MKTIEMPMVGRAASFTPATVNEKARTIDLVWTTGATVRRMDWWTGTPYNEQLVVDEKAIRMDRLNAGASLLNTHSGMDLRDVLGVVERAWLDGKKGLATVRFSEREDVEPIWKDVRAGILRNISVGYAVHRVEKIENKGDKIQTWRIADWEPMELSLVPIPADAGAQVRSAPLYPCEFVEQVFPETGAASEGEKRKLNVKFLLARNAIRLRR